jgi:2-iminobutanoate/2-iminopropanoate deaminase
MNDPRIVSTADAPAAIGPYSQAVAYGGLVYCSGQIALDPAGGEIVAGGVAEQTRQVFQNLTNVLEAAGTSLDRALKMTVYLKSMDDFAAMNEVYGTFFSGESPPARATVEVSRLPKDVDVEIDCVAALRS